MSKHDTALRRTSLENQLQHAWNAYAAMRSMEMGLPDLRDNPAWQIIMQDSYVQFNEAFEATL